MKSSKLFALAGVTLLAAATLAASLDQDRVQNLRKHSHISMKQTLTTSTI